MKLNKIPKTTTKKKKRAGRGYGSGKGGHTVGRGAKGFKARNKVALTFDGAKIKKSFLKRLPLQRGKGKFKSLKPGPIIVNLKYLALFPKGSEIDLRALIKKGIVDDQEAKSHGVKILGEGDLKVSLKVKLPCSKSAAKKIEKAGGKVVLEAEKKKVKKKPAVKKGTPKPKAKPKKKKPAPKAKPKKRLTKKASE